MPLRACRVKSLASAAMRCFYSTSRGRSARCIAPKAGRRQASRSSSRAPSRVRSRRSTARATCSAGIRCDGRGARLRPDRADPRRRPRAVRKISRRVLARARSRARVPDRVRAGADRSRVPRRSHPGGVWRQRAHHAGSGRHHGGDPRRRLQPRRLPRPDVHHGYASAAWQRGAEAKVSSRDRQGDPAAAGLRVTEPTSGTDTLSLRTTATREGNDHYVVDGQKIWTSRAEHSDLMLLLARTTPREQAKRRTDGLSVFLVDMRGTQGLTIRPIRTMMNHATTEVFFDHMRVPAENLIGEEGQGFRYILSGMNAERILIAAECIGDAKWFIG